MAKIVAIANQKGGVGKTTTCINLGASLALAEQRVLLVDLDPQANLTSGVGLREQAAEGATVYHSLTNPAGDPGELRILDTSIQGMKLVPSDRNLTGAEIELVSMAHRESRLRSLLNPRRAEFDFVLIDSPPSLGLLTLNALVAADSVLIPLHCEYFALEGLAELVATLRRVRAAMNPQLGIEGVLLTMHDERTNLGQQVARDVRGFFQDRVFHTVIPRNIRLGEAPSHGMPAILYDAKSRGAEAYVTFARELLARQQLAVAQP